MCRYKCQCCGPCFCCKDNVETAFILGIAYIVLNALFFELLGLGITDGNPTLWIYFESCKIIHPIQHAVLIYGAHKRSTTTILIWIILTAVILTAHVISGTTINCDNYVPWWWVELDDELSWLFTKRMGITEILRRVWLFSANKTKSSESFSKQPTQLIVKLNSSLRQKLGTKVTWQNYGKIMGVIGFSRHIYDNVEYPDNN